MLWIAQLFYEVVVQSCRDLRDLLLMALRVAHQVPVLPIVRLALVMLQNVIDLLLGDDGRVIPAEVHIGALASFFVFGKF